MPLPQLPPSLMRVVVGNNTFDFFIEAKNNVYDDVVGHVVQTTAYTADEPMLLAHSPDGSRTEWRERFSCGLTDLEAIEIMGKRILGDFVTLPKTYPIKTPDTDRAQAADAAYLAHDFGAGVKISSIGVRQRTTTGSRWSRDVHAGSDLVATSIVKFTAVFELGSDKIIETYAVDRDGREWGAGFALDPSQKTIQPLQAIENARRALAEKAFQDYRFGDGVIVEAVNGRESAGESMSRAMFVRTDDDAHDADTTKLKFTVVFARGGTSAIDVYAIGRKGSIWGAPNAEGSESSAAAQRAPAPRA